MITITLAGFALRLYRLDAVPLRGDEAFTLQNWVQQPLDYSLAHIATIEPHPFLNYVFFRIWGLLVGTSEIAIRILPALANTLSIPAIYALGSRLAGKRVGLLAALLWAVHPYQIWHAQDARNNAIWAGFSVISLWLGWRALQQRRWQDWLLYALVMAVTANVFYLELFTIAAFTLFVLISRWRQWQLLRIWLIAQVPAVLGAVVSFIILQGHLLTSGGYGGTIGQDTDITRLWTHFVPTLTFGETLPADFIANLWPIVLLILVVGLIVLWRRNREAALFLTLIGFLPLVMLTTLALRLHIFVPRYVLDAAPAYSLIVAALIAAIWESAKPLWLRRPLAFALMGAWLCVAAFSLYNYEFVPAYAKSKDWPALTNYLHSHVTEDDLVIQLAADAAFGFYYHAPADNIALPASPDQPPTEITAILSQYSTRYHGIWLVGQTFPDWPNVGVVEMWMRDHLQEVRVTQLAGLQVKQYLPWQVNPAEIETSPLAVFADTVELAGARVFPPEPTGQLTVWVYWRPLKTTTAPLKVFIHLEGKVNPDTGSPLWTQDDHFPPNDRVSSSNWSSDVLYRDIYTLPLASVPSGAYTLRLGLYDSNTGKRLTTGDSDSYLIQNINLP